MLNQIYMYIYKFLEFVLEYFITLVPTGSE